MLGRTLAHYEILEPLGQGGMGVVYRARDKKLGREVALKVLPPELTADPNGRARFEREARAVAALNHDNIVTVYAIEEADGVRFLTMELVEGAVLSELIPEQGLSLDTFWEIAIPLADALAAAHEKGITHRDLKPANIMRDSRGRVKVLDFGLAKLAAPDPDLGETAWHDATAGSGDGGGADRGDDALHVSRASRREAGGRALRCLLSWHRALRAVERPEALRG